MGEVNNIVCDYLGLPGYYADFWNGTLFRGKRKIKIWHLQRHDREYYKPKNKRGKTGNVRRDVQMYCKGKKSLKLFPQEEGGLDMCKAFEDERAEKVKQKEYLLHYVI